MADIRADLCQYYPMKDVFEVILGTASFRAVKDYGSLKTWKIETVRLLRAIALSIAETVEVADEEWKADVQAEIEFGISIAKSATKIDELFAGLAATLATLVFLQVGFLPRDHRKVKRVTLSPRNWKLNSVRSVQYVQNEEQKAMQKKIKKLKGSPPNSPATLLDAQFT